METIHVTSMSAAEGGASWITIHGRTKVQGYKPPAYWEPIGEVNRRIGKQVPVIANGDLWTLEDFRKCRDQTGCEHYMLGRSALADPFLAPAIARELGIEVKGTASDERAGDGHRTDDPRSWVPILERFAEICAPYYGDGYINRRIKQWFNFARIPRPLPFWDDIKRMETSEEILAFLKR